MLQKKADLRMSLLVAMSSGVIRDAISQAAAASQRLRMVGEATDFDELQQALPEVKPDIAVLGSGLPGLAEPALLVPSLKEVPQTRVVFILRNHTPPSVIAEIVKLNPRAIIPHELGTADLLRVLELVAIELSVSPPTASLMTPAGVHRVAQLRNLALSRRERDVLCFLAEGRSEKEMAELLGIGLRTVNTYLVRLKSKLHANNRVQAVAVAVAAGLLSAEEFWPRAGKAA